VLIVANVNYGPNLPSTTSTPGINYADLAKKLYSTSSTGSLLNGTTASNAQKSLLPGATPTSSAYNDLLKKGVIGDPMTGLMHGYYNENPLPTAPSLNYSMPDVEQMSWDEALQRAVGMYTPAYNTSVQRQDKQTSDQRALLPQMLAARGYLKGGKLESGDNAITQDQAMARTELDNSFETQKQQAANSIYEGETNRAQAALSNLLAQQNAKNTNAMSQWQTQYNAALQKEQNAQTTLMELARMNQQGEQYNKTFDYTKGRDTTLDASTASQKAATDAEQRRQFDLTYGLQKQTTDYNIGKPYFAPSSGGGITPYQGYEIGRNDQQDSAKIGAQARELASKDTRKWDEAATLKWLTDSYVQAGYDAGTAEQMARTDPRLAPPKGSYSENDLYNSYINDLTRQQYGLPTSNPQ
jgi:hypothetical protein